MSWKSVELQVALPRVQDAGKEQDLMSKQNQRFQEALTQSQTQAEIQKRKQVNKFDELRKANLTNDEQSLKDHLQDENKHEKEKANEEVKHPYLGSNIDING